MQVVWLALAGVAGTLARYGFQGVVQRTSGSAFPWGTLVVNGLGCLAFGVVWSIAVERSLIGEEKRVVLLVGFMGAFTTFSSFAFETAQLIHDSEWWLACANVLAQNGLGILCVFAGMALGRLV